MPCNSGATRHHHPQETAGILLSSPPPSNVGQSRGKVKGCDNMAMVQSHDKQQIPNKKFPAAGKRIERLCWQCPDGLLLPEVPWECVLGLCAQQAHTASQGLLRCFTREPHLPCPCCCALDISACWSKQHLPHSFVFTLYSFRETL